MPGRIKIPSHIVNRKMPANIHIMLSHYEERFIINIPRPEGMGYFLKRYWSWG